MVEPNGSCSILRVRGTSAVKVSADEAFLLETPAREYGEQHDHRRVASRGRTERREVALGGVFDGREETFLINPDLCKDAWFILRAQIEKCSQVFFRVVSVATAVQPQRNKCVS